MPALQSPGLGSGLDVNSMVTQLMAIERRPLQLLDRQEAGYQADISAYGSLKGSLSGLQSSLAKLQQDASFRATTGSASDTEVLTVATDVDTVPSSYDVSVNRLAQRHKLGSKEFASGATLGGGAGDALTLTVGANSFTVDLSSARSLEQIQQLINGDANETGVTAGLITGDNGSQTLVLTADETGYAERVQFSYGGAIDASTFDFSTLNRDADGALLGADTELDAALLVDGVSITRGSNSIADVVTGVTLNLAGTGQSQVTVSRDTNVAKQAVQAFVNTYNSLQSTLSSLGDGVLDGSSVLRSVESQLRGVFNQGATGLGRFSYLAELGVTTGETGNLQLDTAKLTSALAEDTDAVSAFFSDSDAGFAVRLDGALDGFLQSGGVVDSLVDGVNSRIDAIGDRRTALERRLGTTEQRLRDQFTALDGLVSQLTTTSDYLTRQLATLPDLFKKN